MKTKFTKLILSLSILALSLFWFSIPVRASNNISLDSSLIIDSNHPATIIGNARSVAITISPNCINNIILIDASYWSNLTYSNGIFYWPRPPYTISYSSKSLAIVAQSETKATSTISYEFQPAQFSNEAHAIYYAVGLPTGTQNLNINSTNSDNYPVQISVFCGVNQDQPFSTMPTAVTSGWAPQSNNNITITKTGDTIVEWSQSYESGTNIPPTYIALSSSPNLAASRSVGASSSYYIPNSTGTYSYSINAYQGDGYANTSLTYAVLNSTPSPYCGDGLCQTISENCSSCSSDCGACVTNPNANDVTNLFLFSNPYNLYNQTTGKINYKYNQNVLTVHDYIEIRKISSDWSTSTFIATSTIIDQTGLFPNKNNGSSFFMLNGNASTTGLVNYDIIGHLAAYWSPNLGDVPATTTIPYVVTVNWQNTTIPTAADILAASSTNPFYNDQAMYAAACTPEQWATPDPQMWLSGTPMPALNFTVIGCNAKLGLIVAGNKFTSIITNRLYASENLMKNVFPFNVYINLNQAWKNSATAPVLPELSFLTPVNGNLTAKIPTGGTSTATIVLWGKDIFTSTSTLGVQNSSKANQLFLAIKTIIKWSLWGLFGLWTIKNGKAFVKGLTDGK